MYAGVPPRRLSLIVVVGYAGQISVVQVGLAGVNFGFGNAAWGQQNSGSPVSPLHIFGLNLSPTAAYRGIDGKVPTSGET